MLAEYPNIDFRDHESAKQRLDHLLKVSSLGFIPEEPDDRYAEIKYDGYRCQAHISRQGEVQLFTRSGNRFDERCFPKIVKALQGMELMGTILDCELVGTAQGHEGFKQVKTRSRILRGEPKADAKTLRRISKYLETAKENPLELRVFDIMMHQGKSNFGTTYDMRREFLETYAYEEPIALSKRYLVRTGQEVLDLFAQVEKEQGEGLVIKSEGSFYHPGEREWIKIKRFETLDLALIGLCDASDGTRLGKALVGTYNPRKRKYETIGFVNLARTPVGDSEPLSDSTLRMVGGNLLSKPPGEFELGRCEAEKYVHPNDTIIIQVGAMHVDKGQNKSACGRKNGQAYSLRIGHAQMIRRDKSPEQATTTAQVIRMYNTQR